MSIVYLNGSYLPKEEARISPDDRGFLLGDGLYEVSPFYSGRPFVMEGHLERLRHGLEWMRIDADVDGLPDVFARLIDENDLHDAPTSLVYLQITRGAAPRTHYFPPEPVEPTVYAFAKAWDRRSDEAWAAGVRAITVPDMRWLRVDIKSICLLPNAMAYQAALDAGVDDAILVRDGIAIEGTHQNLWAVFDGVAVTHPRTNLILPGITRNVVVELAGGVGVPVEERPILVEEIGRADEVFFTGTTAEVKPCTEVDGVRIGDGRVGPVTRRLADAFFARVEQVTGADAALSA